MTIAALDLQDVRRAYGPIVAVDNVSLTVAKGEFVTLLGPSGSGKTSTLRLVGGFDQLDGGTIRINGERIDHLPAYQRHCDDLPVGRTFPAQDRGRKRGLRAAHAQGRRFGDYRSCEAVP